MKKLRTALRWAVLLGKRLLRRPAYLAVLLLVPAFAAALALFSRQDSGAVTVAICLEDPADPAAAAAAGRLTGGDSVLRCLVYEDASQAVDAVRGGRADAAWIFGGTQGELERFARRGSAGAVTVVEREDNVFLMLAREKLFAALYPELSREIFRDFLAGEPGMEALSAEALREYYAGGMMSEQILRFETVDGEEVSGGSYLTAPLRGILALLTLLCAMASGLYAYREERGELFVWLPERPRRLLPLLCHGTAMLPAEIAALAALALAGVSAGWARELALALLLLVSGALFCELLRCLCPREEAYGALIPILAAAVLLLCPVFLDLPLLQPLRMLLPPYWYLRAVWDGAALLPFLLYTLALALLTLPALRIRQMRRGY